MGFTKQCGKKATGRNKAEEEDLGFSNLNDDTTLLWLRPFEC